MPAARSARRCSPGTNIWVTARKADGVHDSQRGSFLGPEFKRDDIRQFLQSQECTLRGTE